ncbi:MAG: LEA type 2 family protein [Acidobacteria bacterium]|nr:LEA type 2 family protein [Acidobacteriota bacterium]
MTRLRLLLLAAALAAGCATLGPLGAIVQPPRIEEARDQPVEVRLMPPSRSSVFGGATIRLWTRITNPNPYGFTLSSLSGTLFLDDVRAATTGFPLGLPLAAGGDSVIPIEFAISFADLPNLAAVVRRAAAREPIGYRLDGTIGVDAGRLGAPLFGPMTLVRGTID